MAVTIHHDDKFHRAYKVNSTGDIIDVASPRIGGLGSLLSTESHLRIITENLTSGTQIAVKARLVNQPSSSFVTLYTITGNENKLLDLTAWDVVHFEVLTYDGQAGTLYVSGFVKNSPPGIAADTTKITDNDGDVLDLVEVEPGEFGIRTITDYEPTTPKITNFNIAAINTEYSITISTGTKKLLIQHRDGGTIEFGFTSGLATYITLPKGTTYAESDLNLQGQTLYFKSDKMGTLEVLEWF